ncbi:DUF4175 family protein [Polluticoccus soli]|uniref:DUF4175 family protein n=1 Tax=Polluticoccus soli TaxID=3034150 RepID=UPI0023E0A64C|nr:DUF4175 family protein [Flavipsychrobacter sp. JY13-12]
MNNYDWLISRLDAFVRKYYANQVIRGALVLLICLLFYILAVSVGEYFLYMPVWLKVTIVSAFVVLGTAALVAWIIIPIVHMNRLGKTISHEQAAVIVGKHFPEISDKLLNILQLKKQNGGQTSRELLEASINQKAGQLSVIPITNAIDLSKNKRFLPYLLPLVLVMVLLLVVAPNIFSEASSRLLQPTKEFEKPAPFEFVVTNSPLQAVRNSDYTLLVKVKGSTLPAEMSVDVHGDRLSMQQVDNETFKYTFRNVTEAVDFRLFAAGFYSKPHTLKVVQKPVLKAFKVEIDYPAYTGRKDETRSSLGDMTLPAGTLVSIAFIAEHTDEATIKLGDGQPVKLPKQSSMYASNYRFMNDTTYTLTLRNRQAGVVDSYQYNVKVIPDEYPVIQLQEFRDTVSGKQILLNGTAGDDYAITKVLFHYQVVSKDNKTLSAKSIALNNTGGALTTFQHYFDIGVLNLQPGEKITYFVEAWDNDGVHGSKASRSEVMAYHMYSPQQLDSAINANAEQINSGMSNSSEQMKQLQSEYKDMQSKMLQSGDMDWEQQQQLQELAKAQEQLKNKLEAVKKRMEEQRQQSAQKQYSDDVKEKQAALEKQMDNLLNKELTEQMKRLQELMQKLNKDQAFKSMKQLEQDNKLFNMDMSRLGELIKTLEMQMKLEDMANRMSEMAQKQDDIQKQTEKGAKDNESLKKDQDDLKKQLDEALTKDLKEMQDAGKETQQKPDFSETQKDGKEASEKMEDSKQELSKDQNSKAGQSQNQAKQNLQKMAMSMQKMAGGMNAMQLQIDIRATRQLLTNLMRLSFDQEKLMKGVQNTSAASATYLANQKEQTRLHNNSRMIRDSLFMLSKRLFQLAPTVNKETTELEKNMAGAAEAIEGRRVVDAATRQQYVMTHTNNLALMLNELLSNLLAQQSQQQGGQSGSCSMPGGKNPSQGAGDQLGDVITKQKQLGDAMQQMKSAQGRQQGQQGEQGESGQDGQGGKEDKQRGGAGGNGEYGDAEQLAKMAEQQAEIRRQLQDVNRMLNSKGLTGTKELQELQQQMDRNETDLVNRRMSAELLARQKEILTRLLQAEKSLREQEQDDKRSSKSAEDVARTMPAELQKYVKDRQQLLELYKTVPPQLKPYYRTMVEQYYQLIGTK